MQLDVPARSAVRVSLAALVIRGTRRGARGSASAAMMTLLAGLTALLVGLSVPGQAAADDSGRYHVLRARDLLVRLDTATGQVWTVPTSGDGGWLAMDAPPDAAGQPEVAGRYKVIVLGPGGGRRGAQQGKGPIRLLRTDRATGRGWLAYADPEGSWTLIEGAPGLSAPQ